MIDTLLDRIYRQGQTNDASAKDRSDMAFNITPTTGQFLDVLVTDSSPKRILEIGTSTGYSTIWLARAAGRIGATVDTIDSNPAKHATATANIREAGLDEIVTLHRTDAGDYLVGCKASEYDFVFLDSDRSQYVRWATKLLEVIEFGMLVVDNAESHAEEIGGFVDLIRDCKELDSIVLPIGKGQLVVRGK